MNRFLAAAATSVVLGLAAVPAIPEAGAQDRIREKIQSFSTEGGFLGIEMEEVTADNMAAYKLSSERGVIVRSVNRESPAEEAKIAEKDVIVEYDSQPVVSTMQLARLVRETPAGRRVPVVVSRDGKKVSLTVKIAKLDRPVLFRSEARPGFRVTPDGRSFEFDGRRFEFQIPEGRNFGFAIPERGIFRSETRPRLGVTLETLTEQLGEHMGVPEKRGALVTSVSSGSAAASAGLKAGDVIIRADGRTVDSPEDVLRAVDRLGGEKLELKVIRDKKETTVVVTLPKESETRTRGGFRL